MMNPTPPLPFFLGLSPRQVVVDALVSACTILIQLFQAPHLLTPFPS